MRPKQHSILLMSIAMAVSLLACNGASMSGGSGKTVAPAPATDASKQEPLPSQQTADAVAGTATGAALPSTPISNPTVNTKPDTIVDDGTEVFSSIDRCLARARELSPRAGFMADMSRTINLGFYKVDPAQGLCDIHFMADLSLEIADHNGRDSVLYQQVALYCPCNGPWARVADEW